MQFVMFAKHLQEWPLAKAAAAVAELGFEGLDLTVREGGYVLPGEVGQALPEALRICGEAGLTVPMLTTNITRIDRGNALQILETAAELGVTELKYGYHSYRRFGEFRPLVEQARADLAGVAEAAARLGVRVNLHIHSGPYVTANAPIVAQLIADYPPEVVGAYLDLGHMVIEGGVDCWRQGLEMLVERSPLLAIKSLGWLRDGTKHGPASYRWAVVPLAEGPVDFTAAWRYLIAGGFDGIVTLHSEYQGGHSFRDLSVEEVIAQTRVDLAYLLACRDEALAG
ncbi:MAG TPA: sugar phosphate isomerase/epimerase [Armatimonadetes bacterium]|nr:sugar phosphate isomerase/epimerase [Armatimonadota bacterium]